MSAPEWFLCSVLAALGLSAAIIFWAWLSDRREDRARAAAEELAQQTRDEDEQP